MPKGGKRTGAGRKPKPQIPLSADKGIATTVLSMDGPPPDHQRKCRCEICSGEDKKKCECTYLESDKGEAKIKIECRFCRIRFDHKICRCEVCAWWDILTATDRRLRFDGRRYLTDRRDGKPAQGVFLGDTRESVPTLTRGNSPSYFSASQPAGSHKPN